MTMGDRTAKQSSKKRRRKKRSKSAGDDVAEFGEYAEVSTADGVDDGPPAPELDEECDAPDATEGARPAADGGGDGSRERKKRKRKGKKGRKRKKLDDDADDADDGNDGARPSKGEDPVASEGEEDPTRSAADGIAAAADGGDKGEGDVGGDEGAEEEPRRRRRKRSRKKRSHDDEGAGDGGDGPAGGSDARLVSAEYTVFVEGLPFSSTVDEVRSFFVDRGCADILQLRLPTWQDTGRLRGFGHVAFASRESRDRALGDGVNGEDLGGRYVAVREANAPRAGTLAGAALGGMRAREQPAGCRTIFVRNLPYDATEEDIAASFRACGKISPDGVRVARNVAGTSKGFGYVEFKQPEGAYAAVQRATKPFGIKVLERPAFVDYDEGSVRGSFRDGEGRLWSKGREGGGEAGRGWRGSGRGGRGTFSVRGSR